MKKKVHKYEWQYTRSWRYYWIDNSEMYEDGEGNKNRPRYYCEIHCCTPYGQIIQREYGYDLFYKGKKVIHGKTVKELKQFAKTL